MAQLARLLRPIGVTRRELLAARILRSRDDEHALETASRALKECFERGEVLEAHSWANVILLLGESDLDKIISVSDTNGDDAPGSKLTRTALATRPNPQA